jgi:Glycosyl transferase 4-like domain
MKTLLLVTESFPPLNTIAAQRFPPMLPVLEASGWRVFVLTKEATGPLPVPLAADRIIRIGRHHQGGLTIRADSHFSRGSRGRAVLRRVYNATGLTLYSLESSLLTWHRAVTRDLDVLRARVPRIDIVIGTYGPAASLWLARRLGGLYGAPWIADFRDPAALRTNGRRGYACWLDRRIEARLLRSAAAVTTCGEYWAAMLRSAYGRPTHVLYNGFDREVLIGRDLPEPSDLPPGPFLHYAGRFYARQMAGVGRLLESLRGTPFRIVMRSLGPAEREAEIVARARALGVLEQLEIRPPMPLAEVTAEAGRASANLVLETVSTAEAWTRGHLSGKFLQLMPLRPPILYVGRPDAEAGDILRRTGKGVLCATVDELRAALARIEASIDWPVDAQAVRAYAKNRQGERLLQLLETVGDGRGGPARSVRPVSPPANDHTVTGAARKQSC